MEDSESISRSNLAFVNATTVHPYHVDPSFTGLFNVTIHPDEDWTILTDPVERRRVQNRIAQRGYRNRLKHSKKASATSTASDSAQPGPSSSLDAGTVGGGGGGGGGKQRKSASNSSKNGGHERPSKKQLRSPVNASPLQVSTHYHFVRGRGSASEAEWASPNGTPSSTLPSPSRAQGIPAYPEPAFLSSPPLVLDEIHVRDPVAPFGDAAKSAGGYLDSMLACGLRRAGPPDSWQASPPYSQDPSQESSPESTARAEAKELNHADGGTALHRAALCGHDSVVETLLEGGADLEARNRHGLSALHLVALKGHQGLVRLLLDQGADANARSRTGKTPLHLAAERNESAVACMLLRHKGSDPNVRDTRGQTPLHVASENGHAAVVSALLERGADIDMRDYAGLTALHQASILGREAMVKLLLQMGADIHAKSDKG